MTKKTYLPNTITNHILLGYLTKTGKIKKIKVGKHTIEVEYEPLTREEIREAIKNMTPTPPPEYIELLTNMIADKLTEKLR